MGVDRPGERLTGFDDAGPSAVRLADLERRIAQLERFQMEWCELWMRHAHRPPSVAKRLKDWIGRAAVTTSEGSP